MKINGQRQKIVEWTSNVASACHTERPLRIAGIPDAATMRARKITEDRAVSMK